MDELLRRFRHLPKRPMCCQGEIVPWPNLVRGDDGKLFRPHLPLWVEVESGVVHGDSFLRPGDDLLLGSLLSLGGFVATLLEDRCCPERLQVRHAELAEYLRRNMQDTGIEVQLTDELPELDKVVAEMTHAVGTQADGLPSLLDSQGITLEQIRAFAGSAAAFYYAAPWRYLCDSDLIHVESPRPPRGMTYFIVLGAGRSTYGLGLYPNRDAYDRFLRAGQTGDYGKDLASDLAQVVFEPIEGLPVADVEMWIEHHLPVAGEQAYPAALKYRGAGKIERPTKKELCFLEGLLRTLADTTENEIDTGRWSKTSATIDGPMTFTLAIPDLLDPPSPQEWMKRGFFPDQRAHERMFADMNRYLADHPLKEGEGVEQVGRIFSGRSLDKPLTQPRTAAEQAQELCFQAFDTHGRRRIQLARQALKLDPDCADARVILAEQAGTPEEELDHYQRGMEAAERRLGSEFFAENVGHFWGISDTRPYMRIRLGLANSLAAGGRVDEAIAHYFELLRLNPNDNQGVRYLVLPQLLAVGRDVEAARLLKQFDEETANWAYARALLAFRLGGRCAASRRELDTALRSNPHLPELLGSDSPIPEPPHYALGSFEEACVAAFELRPVFRATPGALEWVLEAHAERARASNRVRREKRRKERAKEKTRKRR